MLANFSQKQYSPGKHSRPRGRSNMAQYAAAIDQGTTGTRFMVFDRQGQVVASLYEEHTQIFP